MSTFGKKALIRWNYDGKFTDNECQPSLRFRNSSLDIQLSILEKWYPIGMEVYIIYYGYTKRNKRYRSSIKVIDQYSIHGDFYQILVKDKNNISVSVDMFKLIPTDNWLKIHRIDTSISSILE